MKKLIFLIFIAFTLNAFAQSKPIDKARGLFIAFDVGPRLPLGYFANSTDLGYGFDVELSYTDDEYLPFFLFTKIGLDQFPGSQQFYEITDYSNYFTRALPVSMGVRYFFPPLVENIVLFMPIVELSADYTFFEKLHQFKPATGKSNYIEDNSKIGFSAGAGISMFMMEVVAAYHYTYTNQYMSVDLRVRLPLYINL